METKTWQHKAAKRPGLHAARHRTSSGTHADEGVHGAYRAQDAHAARRAASMRAAKRVNAKSGGGAVVAKTRRRMPAAIAAAVAVVLLVPAIVAYAATLTPDTSWYEGHESDTSYTLSDAGDLMGLAEIVNGTTAEEGDITFEGKTITLDGTFDINFAGKTITPIGTEDHPFNGTFDGNGMTVDNFAYTSTDDDGQNSYIGLFGYVGESGSIKNLTIGSSATIDITRTDASTQTISNVGMVVGYCGGTIDNCTNKGTITISSNVAQQSSDNFIMIECVGGVAGTCVYDVTNCTNIGALNLTESSAPVSSIDRPGLIDAVGGVVGFLGDPSKVGNGTTFVYTTPTSHGSISNCTNTGKLTLETPSSAGTDRFGMATTAESYNVGGIAGYSQGSIYNCTNGKAQATSEGEDMGDYGYLRAANASNIGGIVGSLRGEFIPYNTGSYATTTGDDGADGNDPLTITGCTNYGDVYGRVASAGIAGMAGSYTTVTDCVNSNQRDYYGNSGDSEVTYIIATRWNKPHPAGIVGTSYGTVSYCANFGTVASAVYADEDSRDLTLQTGYYASGIVGMLFVYSTTDESTGAQTNLTPTSEVYGCYNAGYILANGNYRQRAIVGEDEGYVHNNVGVEGFVENDQLVYGDEEDETEATGQIGTGVRANKNYSASELRSESTQGEAIALLNYDCEADGWASWWVRSSDNTSSGPFFGYPVLNGQSEWTDTATDISDATVTLTADATYTGGEALPEVSVALNGTTLIRDVDYRVLPQSGATAISDGRTYSATIVGLGKYSGTASTHPAYAIVSGDLSTCSVVVEPAKYNYTVQVPDADAVTVTTSAGTVVDPSEYTYQIVDDDGNEIEPMDADTYTIRVTANSSSTNFTGTVDGTYRIKPVNLMRDVTYSTISFAGETYPFKSTTISGESEDPSTVLPYIGATVEPTVNTITYLGHTLVQGVDYNVIYGNLTGDDAYSGDLTATNDGIQGGTSVGALTVRNVYGSNFTNYTNMMFKITDSNDTAIDISTATIEAEDQIYDGTEQTPVKVYMGAQELTEGVNYSITYSDNVEVGTASYTVTGMDKFTGSVSGTFEIEDTTVYELQYEYSGSGTTADPYVATVTGVEYYGNRDTFALTIPETVEYNGHTYTVTAIGDDAFGGSSRSDFVDSTVNESKVKISSVVIPATVTTIGEYAFGSGSPSFEPALSSVTFEDGSQLTTIGENAFRACKELTEFTFPENVATIDVGALRDCTSIEALTFLTESATLPSSVAEGAVNGAFRNIDGATVYGNASATAVQAIATNNSGTTAGTNGGKNFTFEAFAGSLNNATVSAISSQSYTGLAITPTPTVTLGGTTLTAGTDYTLSYTDNVEVGTATVTITGKGSYTGSTTATFRITKYELTEKDQISPINDIAYTGSSVSISPTVATKAGTTLTEGEDYTLSYADESGTALTGAPSEVGTYRLVVTGKGSYTGSLYRTFHIVNATLDDADVSYVTAKTYTGDAITPEPIVYLSGTQLTEGEDYFFVYADNVDAGTATLTVVGTGGYTGSTSAQFTINAADISSATIADIDDVTAGSSTDAEVSPTVVFNGAELVEGTDYTVSYQTSDGTALSAAPTEAGTYQVVITGEGNFTGTATKSYNVVASPTAKTSLASATVALASSDELVYTGERLQPAVTVTLSGTQLTEGTDYLVTYTNNIDASAVDTSSPATVTVVGTGSYTGTASTTFTIEQRPISEATFLFESATYTGSAVTPDISSASYNGIALTEGTDYELGDFGNNVEIGDAAWRTITGLGNFSGTVNATFSISGIALTGSNVSDISKQIYTGEAIEPAVTVTASDGTVLTEGTDYELSYVNNTERGTASAIVTGIGSYAGTVTKNFQITGGSLTDATVEGVTSKIFTGSPITLDLTVTVGGAELVEGTDYTVTYTDNTDVGTATVKIVGAGDYSGTITRTFAITKCDLSNVTYVGDVVSKEYTGSAITQDFTLTLGDYTLTQGKDYVVSYSNNIEVSELTTEKVATYVITGTGNFSGTMTKTFTITRVDISGATVSDIPTQAYTGEAVTPEVTVTLDGTTLTENTDYVLTYAHNIDVGTATVTVTGAGNYTGTVAQTFEIATRHKIIKNYVGGDYGTVTIIDSADGTTATMYPCAGNTVTFRTHPNTGYTLTRMSYTYTDPDTGKTVTKALKRISGTGRAGTNSVYSFTMPDADVTLNATFSVNKRTITKDISGSGLLMIVNNGDGVTASLYPQVGTTVRFKAIPSSGYKLTSIHYTIAGTTKPLALTKVAGTTNVYEFTMPNYDVTLTGTFVEK
jgi:hypothetical protein